MGRHQLLVIIIILVCITAGCSAPEQAIVERDLPEQGDADAGRQHIIDYGCGACHRIEGIRDANGVVGAPLVDYETQHYIAGELPNNAVNLAMWIQNPQEIEPDTAMPNLGVTYQEAMDIVAYFYSR
jgi:cytochrome c